MQKLFILIAEDDADDRFLLQTAFEENGFTDTLEFVENGIELIDYLSGIMHKNPGRSISGLDPAGPEYA
ncbi:hypothetical protein [Paraflavitalea speifideaquila]|uniref:hypothetical protein n=1 Tax=Paraflavitalea speifideaquila TaxID=3076558 RepID=UPI0028F1463C|nr:hypothetical protein [Paraflavitalea speifideiaquila]